ncbi:MAG TPA: hypothetical protein VI172_04580 [Candidatus Dormibacteraeota bacterium]
MKFRWYLAYLTVLAATAVALVSVLPGATAAAATVTGSAAAVCGLLYTPRKERR